MNFDNAPTPVENPSYSFRHDLGVQDDTAETVVSFSPGPDFEPPDPPRRFPTPPRRSPPVGALNREPAAVIPPLVLAPRRRVLRPLGTSASSASRRRRLSLPWPLVASFGVGAAVASMAFLLVGEMRPVRPVSPRRPVALSPRGPAEKVVPVNLVPLPAPAPVAAPVATTVRDTPPVAAGKQVARALRSCRVHRKGSSLRLAVRLGRDAVVHRVFIAPRKWLDGVGRRCIHRQLTGLKLEQLTGPGYLEWHVWPDAEPRVLVLRQRVP